MATWSFLSNHGRALVCIAGDPDVRLRDIAAALALSERRTNAIISELTVAGYVVKRRDGRRNRYQVRVDLPLPEFASRDQAIGVVLDLLAFPHDRRRWTRRASDRPRPWP